MFFYIVIKDIKTNKCSLYSSTPVSKAHGIRVIIEDLKFLNTYPTSKSTESAFLINDSVDEDKSVHIHYMLYKVLREYYN